MVLSDNGRLFHHFFTTQSGRRDGETSFGNPAALKIVTVSPSVSGLEKGGYHETIDKKKQRQ